MADAPVVKPRKPSLIGDLVILLVFVGIVLGVGWLVANSVKSDPAKTCTFGMGPAKEPTLCYIYTQVTSYGTQPT
ncbi:Uncharacterised protein [uncultured archaeon]|nr:Uncharacterised protein [uncultured archaeon]